ncbi:MAG: protein kinase [Spirochaetes bacterium]|nr:protein kinase [Spirochaetota bacterium]
MPRGIGAPHRPVRMDTMDIYGKIIHNRYQIDKKIDEDTLSYFHLGYDLSPKKRPLVFRFLKNNVISKRIEDIIRFRIEVNAVAELEHENIIKIIEVGELFELIYVAMEYFPGTTLHTILNDKKITVNQGIEIVMQLCWALEHLHRHNIIHRDIKPSNVLVNNRSVKLSGFGLSHLREFNETVMFEEIIKNFKYISPEQCGILKRNIDERSDMYSVGVILFQVLTGRVPFEGPDICSIIHQHVAKLPEPPSLFNSEVPPILDQIVMKLLDKEPENRYQSARGLASDLERYLSGQNEFILGLDDRFTKLSFRTRLIGRQEEMSRLGEIIGQLRNGIGGVYFISGEAGSGKTRLIEELKAAVYATGSIMIEGKCSLQSNKVPYAPIKEAFDSFMVNYHNLSESQRQTIADRIREEFGNLGELLIKFNPSMKEILGECQPLVALEPEREYKRFHMIVSKFLLSLSRLANGMVLVIEDLHGTDEGTLTLLNELIHDISDHPLAIIGSYRNDEVPESHGLRKFQVEIAAVGIPFSRIHLNQFDEMTMRSFVAGLLLEKEENIPAISDFVLQKSGGNPFFAIEVLKQLIEESVLSYRNNRWAFDNKRLASVAISASIVDIILNRIKNFNKNERDILSLAAVMGEKFNMRMLFKLTNLDQTEIVSIIDKAIGLQLLVDLPTWGEIGFAHDRIREAFYDSIPKIRRQQQHIEIANAIEDSNRENLRPVIFDLAHHFIEGGDTDRAVIFAFPAGVMSMEKYSNEEAVKYFKLALSLLEQEGLKKSPQWVKILANLSKVYLTVGSYEQAIEILLTLPPLMETNIDKADIYSHICSAYIRKGEWKKCEDYAVICGRLLGEYFTENKLILLIIILKELIVLLVHFLFSGMLIRKKVGKVVEYNKLKAKFALPVLWAYIFTDNLKFFRFTLRGLNVAVSKIGKSPELGMAISGFGGILMAMGWFRPALHYLGKSLSLREEMNDHWGAAQSFQFLGICHQWAGNYRKSIECFEESIRRFTDMGDIWEIGNSCAGLLQNYLLMSDYKTVKDYLDRYYSITNETNDFYGINEAWIHSTPYFLETGNIDTAEWLGNTAYNFSLDTTILFSHCRSCIEIGRLYLEKREIPRAIEYLEKAHYLYRTNDFLKDSTVHLFPALAEAYLAEYIANSDLARPQRKELLRRAKKFCAKALKKTKRWQTHYGLSLLVNAKYYAATGRMVRAEKFFHMSIEHHKKYERRFYLGKSHYEYGLFLSQTDSGASAKKCLETAYRIFIGIGALGYIEKIKNLLGIKEDNGEPTSIERRIDTERLASVVSLAREISHISDTEQLLDMILSKAVEITGAQRGCIFIVDEKGDLVKKSVFSMLGYDTTLDQYSMNIIRAVYNTQNQIILGDAEVEDVSLKDKTYPHPKSILCVPIKERDRVIGVCYLDNSLTGGVFTEKESNLLLTFLSHIAFATEIEILNRKFKNSKTPEKKIPQSGIISEKMKKAVEYIHENYAYDISREGLASYIGLHHDNLGRYFKIYHGKKLNDYINELRIHEAARKLTETDEKIIDIAFAVGFGSLRTFNKSFRQIMKVSPADYRKKNS